MSQPKKPPLSLRVPDPLRVRVDQWAAAQKLSRNAAYVQLLERGMGMATKPVAKLPVGPQPVKPGERLKKR